MLNLKTPLLVTLLLVLPFSAAGQETIPQVPVWPNDDDFVFGVLQYEASTEIDFEDADGPQHTLELAGYFQPEEEADIVCVTEVFSVLRAEDDERDDIYLPGRRRSQGIESVDFAPVLDRVYFNEDGLPMVLALIEVDEAELRRAAYTIEELEIKGQMIVAKKREVVEIPAIVTDNVTRTDFELSFRLSEMRIGRDNEAEVSVEVERGGGEGKPILDALYAVDDRGNRIGGGRWGKPETVFAERGTFEIEFVIDDNADVDHLELVIVTEYELKDVTFTITDLFQQ